MKIVYFWSYYEQYLANFYQRHPGVADMPYVEQYELLLDDYFGIAGSYTRWANKLGHESYLLINNCEPLQRQWAKENNVTFTDNWQIDVALEQIKRLKPDIFFMSSMFNLYGAFLAEAKKLSRKVMGWIACPIPEGQSLNQMDLIFTSSPSFVDFFRRNGVNSELLLPAFDPNILFKLSDETPRDIDVSFIGGITIYHKQRRELLERLAAKTHLKVWGYWAQPSGRLARIRRKLFPSPFERSYNGEVWGMDMYRTLNRSKIVLNSHIDVAYQYAGNMRMFETTGVGSLLLTDNKSNLSDIFIPDKEVVAYSTIEEAVEKIEFYLSHGKVRCDIARAGQQRTIKNYNYQSSVLCMLNYFKKYS